jgi:small subunit ribosomal protein S13
LFENHLKLDYIQDRLVLKKEYLPLSEFRYIVRIADADLRGSESLESELTKIKGISINLAKAILKAANLTGLQVGYMKDMEAQKIEDVLANPETFGIPTWLFNRQKDLETGKNRHLIGSNLTLQTEFDVNLMKETRSWKGIRHGLGLKVRGQRTKTTARSGRVVSVRRSTLRRTRQ